MRSEVLLLLAAGLTGCAPYATDACTSDSACREAFGLGYACGPDGWCDAVAPSVRCTESYPSDALDRPESYSDAVVLGSLFDRGPDLPNAQAAQLAVREAAEEGGLDGRDLVLLSCTHAEDLELDTLTQGEAAATAVAWLADMGASVVLGPGSSGVALYAYSAAAERDVLLIAPSTTSPALTAIDGETSTDTEPGLFWRTAPPDTYQARAIVADLSARDVTSLAILYQDGAYGTALAGLVADGFLTGTANAYPFTTANERNAAVQAIGNTDADEVLIISSEVADIVAVLNTTWDLAGYADKGFFLTDSAVDPTLLSGLTDDAKDQLIRIRGTAPRSPSGDTYELFRISYQSEYGTDPADDGWNAFAYDAGWLALYGLAWADLQESDLTSGLAAARGLRRVSDAAGTEISLRASSWSTLQSEFSAGRAVDAVGASGLLDFDPDTGETTTPVEIWRIEDGDFVTVALCDPDGQCVPT